MGHAHHFLSRLERVNDEQVELALSLYRDHLLLRAVLDLAKLPEGAERVAISLEDPKLGPFIIVTRAGHFVTCLGKGMGAKDTPIITRGQLDKISLKIDDLRERLDFAKRNVRTRSERRQLMARIEKHGETLCREDFVSISAFAPLLAPSYYQDILSYSTALELERQLLFRGGKKANEEALHEAYSRMFAIGHLSVLSVMGDHEFLTTFDYEKWNETFSYTTSQQMITDVALKGAWAAARLGKPVLGSYKAMFAREPPHPDSILDGLVGMGAIATRHSSTLAEIQKVLTAAEHAVPKSTELTLEAIKGGFGAILNKVLSGDKEHDRVISAGREIIAKKAEVLVPKDSPVYFAKAEDVPEDLALTAALNFRLDMLDPSGLTFLLNAVPYAARAKPEDFYFPRAMARYYAEPFWPARASELLQLASATRFRKTKPAASNKTVGRNDPCPCGSGKKYKKCHGASA